MPFDPSKELISSRSNKDIKRLKALTIARNRYRENKFLIDGLRIVEEAMEREGCVDKLIVTPHALTNSRVATLVSTAREKGIDTLWVADRVIDYISETKTSQGIMALVRPASFSEADLDGGLIPMVVVAHLLQDPGNLGTIIRTAEAAGIGGVVTTPGTVDLYNPKALRGSMGSIFRLPTVKADSLSGVVDRFRQKGYRIAAAMVSAKTNYFDIDFSAPTVLLVGQEGAGLPEDAYGMADTRITIPMATMLDSLNVAAATTAIMYEAVRQSIASGRKPFRRQA